uniref:Uncharacterized protein n=1 Tax=Ananas comosus var. bracteatus TaxID=296719 RepID=A0A6V7P5M4_ANACO|nr:unnamed protein product [Ananas comosus var. bracteatus]
MGELLEMVGLLPKKGSGVGACWVPHLIFLASSSTLRSFARSSRCRSDSCSLSGRIVGLGSWLDFLASRPFPLATLRFVRPLDAAPTPIPSLDGVLGRVHGRPFSGRVVPVGGASFRLIHSLRSRK